MYKELELLTTEGKKKFPMLANGATSVRYRQAFQTDLMSGIARYANISEDPGAIDWELPSKLAYVMNMAATGADMNRLSPDGYLSWLEQFEGDTLWLAQGQIADIYLANQRTLSTGKK